MLLVVVLFIGVLLMVCGHYRSQISAMKANPQTHVRIIPRTMYDDVMGVNWVSEAK